MKKITRITTQQKRKNRFNIFLDDGHGEKYGFSVDEAVLIEYKLRKNLELTDSMIETLIQKDDVHKSYTLTINFLSYRMRTKKEIHDYLIKKEVDEEPIKQIMDRLTSEGLLDDAMFADAFVRTRIQTSIKGPMLVKKELMEKGVSQQIAAKAIELYTFDVQLEKTNKWINKKLNKQGRESFKKQLQQLQGTLMQKGFEQDVIKEAIADLGDEKDDGAEWEAIKKHGEKLISKHKAKLTGFHLQNKVKEGLYRKGFTMEMINDFLDEAECE
ncbi:recombination regulator RecX [Virgibacillus phasianinus]|uniref:Regulatory protein RecX n=1 Tax=Virgibacillus phasianinus TaxID=2017483 RepID=A0A220TZ25_9BACI|nr:recombination regulator RecX [Virgibacillus phasianinus]ASK61057.1 recombination regulator RecX [Virgibacillus phasianinus]